MMKVRKLDRRYNGHGFWTHRAEPGGWYGADARLRGLVGFYEQREFLNRSFGMGAFIEEVHALQRSGREIPKWGFDAEGNIFLRDEALVQFQLAIDRWNQ